MKQNAWAGHKVDIIVDFQPSFPLSLIRYHVVWLSRGFFIVERILYGIDRIRLCWFPQRIVFFQGTEVVKEKNIKKTAAR